VAINHILKFFSPHFLINQLASSRGVPRKFPLPRNLFAVLRAAGACCVSPHREARRVNVFAVLRTASMQYVVRHRECTAVEFPNSWNVTCKEACNGD
jgi:hypothetical protein